MFPQHAHGDVDLGRPQAENQAAYRRMDAGAVGSLVADYPLQITPPNNARIMNTMSYLMSHWSYGNAFFQDMIHSGIYIYLTLAMAQTFLRSQDTRYRDFFLNGLHKKFPCHSAPASGHIPGRMCPGTGAAPPWQQLYIPLDQGLSHDHKRHTHNSLDQPSTDQVRKKTGCRITAARPLPDVTGNPG